MNTERTDPKKERGRLGTLRRAAFPMPWELPAIRGELSQIGALASSLRRRRTATARDDASPEVAFADTLERRSMQSRDVLRVYRRIRRTALALLAVALVMLASSTYYAATWSGIGLPLSMAVMLFFAITLMVQAWLVSFRAWQVRRASLLPLGAFLKDMEGWWPVQWSVPGWYPLPGHGISVDVTPQPGRSRGA